MFNLKNNADNQTHETQKDLDLIAKKLEPLTKSVEIPRALDVENILFDEKNISPSGFSVSVKIIALAASLVLIVAGTLTGLSVMKKKTTDLNFEQVSNGTVSSEESLIPEISEESALPSSSQPESSIASKTSPKPPVSPEPREEIYVTSYEAVYKVLEKFKTSASSTPKTSMTTSVNQTAPLAEMAPSAEGTASSNDDYGTTNTQVNNVDEADIIKNDGQHIYTLSKITTYSNGKTYPAQISIVKASADGIMTKLSNIAIDKAAFKPSEMYVKGNRLVVAGTVSITGSSSAQAACTNISYGSLDSCALIYDISDRENPALIRTFTQQGGNIRTRMIGNKLYLISTYYAGSLNKLSRENIENYIPHTKDSVSGDKIVPATSIALMQSIQRASFAIITRLNIDNKDEKPVTESAMGAGNNVYASQTGIYLASENYNYDAKSVLTTYLLRFRIGDSTLRCEASGKVEGRVKNQFFMDEYDGYFRIVTDKNNNGQLFVLDKDLKIKGKIDKIAPGEIVKSVRFMGAKAYIVTFLQVDPLFSVDLSSPANPKVTGQLKIPGFSAYLHPYDDETLIGIGVLGTGIQFSLFDVKNPANPKVVQQLVIGSSSTIATSDHKAVMFDKTRNFLAVPYQTSGASAFNGLIVLSVDKTTGFKRLADITHSIPSISYEGKFQYVSNLDSILRSTYIGDAIFTMSNGMLMSADSKSWQRISEQQLVNAEQKRNINQYANNDIIAPAARDVLVNG